MLLLSHTFIRKGYVMVTAMHMYFNGFYMHIILEINCFKLNGHTHILQ